MATRGWCWTSGRGWECSGPLSWRVGARARRADRRSRPDIARVVVDLTGERPIRSRAEAIALVVYFPRCRQLQCAGCAGTSNCRGIHETSIRICGQRLPRLRAQENASNAAAPRSAADELTSPPVLGSVHEEECAGASRRRSRGIADGVQQQQRRRRQLLPAASACAEARHPAIRHYNGRADFRKPEKTFDLKDFFPVDS